MKLRKASDVAIVIIALINLYFMFAVRILDKDGTNWQSIIYSDGKGYYEYLRAAFVKGSLSQLDSSKGFIRATDNGYVIKYFVGTAVAQFPFFLVAKFISFFRSKESDGYTFEFQVMIAVAGYFYLLLGLFFLRKWFQLYLIPDNIIAITLPLIVYGTNLFYYSIFEPSMSHVYGFAFTTFFLYKISSYFKGNQIADLLTASIAFGIALLIRPTHLIFLFMLPFCAGSYQAFVQSIKWEHLLFSGLAVTGILMIQPLVWKIESGNWLVWSYVGEGFYFIKPAFADVLFSFNKGWFIYTPLSLFALAGLFPLWRRSKWQTISVVFTLASAVYVTASWWCWNYGDSFGMRPMIDYYAVVAMLLAVLFSAGSNRFWMKALAGTLCSGIIMLSIVQTYQYYHNFLQHYSMDKAKYKYIFLKTGDAYKNVLGGNIDLMPFTVELPVTVLKSEYSFSDPISDSNFLQVVNDPEDSENKCCLIDSVFNHLDFAINVNDAMSSFNLLWIEMKLKRKELYLHSSSSAEVEAEMKNNHATVYTYRFALNDYPDDDVGKWRHYQYAFWIRRPVQHADSLILSIKNHGGNFLIDDVELLISGIRKGR